MARKKSSVPAYRHHKPTGQAYMFVNGERRYLGRFDSPVSKATYRRLLAELASNNGRLRVAVDELRIVELCDRWNAHAKTYYSHRKGDPFKTTLAVLVQLYGSTKAAEFGPKCLKTVRAAMVAKGWSRPTVNERIQQVRAVFKWGVSEELVPPLVMEGLRSVIGLKRGRTEAPEPTPVQSVADHVVDQTLPHMTPTVRAMVEFQRLVGCRPGEVCVLRTCDLDTSGKVWTFTPSRHKTQHHGRARVVYIGPRGQDVLRPWLKTDLAAYVFTPKQSAAEWLVMRRAARKTPIGYGNGPGTNKKPAPERTPGELWTTQEYGKAIASACDRAWPIPEGMTDPADIKLWRREHRWSANRLRHSFATTVRREHGLEAAQLLLGHAACDVTQVYAERDTEKAKAVAAKIG